MSEPKYRDVVIELTDRDGNPYAIIGRVQKKLGRYLKHIGATDEQIRAELEKFRQEATSSDYENVLATCMRWVDFV